MSDLDLLLTVGVDKNALVKSFVDGMKEAQKQAEKETIVYKLKADEKDFLSEVKSLLNSTPDLDKDIKIVLDDSSFKKGLDDITSYAGKSAKSITSSFKKEFQNEFSKNDSLYLDNILGLSKDENKSVKKVKTKLKEITEELKQYTNYTEDKNGIIKIGGIDTSKVSDYKDLEKVVNLTKELDAILKQTGAKGYKVDLIDRKQLEDSVKNLQSGYSKAIIEYGDTYKTQLEKMKSDTTNTFTQLKQLLESVFVDTIDQIVNNAKSAGTEINKIIEGAIQGTGDSISSEIQEGVISSKKHLQDLESQLDSIKKKKSELSKPIDVDDLYSNLEKAADKVNRALEQGDEVIAEDAKAYADAMEKLTSAVASTKGNKRWEEAKENYTAVRGELGENYIPIEKMKTRLSLLNQLTNEERSLEQEITKEKKAIDEVNQKREESVGVSKAVAEEASDANIKDKINVSINEQETIESINKISEALQELLKSENNIEVKVRLASDYIDSIQNQLDSIEPKPKVDVEPRIISSDKLSTDEIKEAIGNVNTEPVLSLEESNKYIDELKSGLRDIVEFNNAINLFEDIGDTTEVEKLQIELNKIIDKYPELEKIQSAFSSRADLSKYFDTNDWNDFLATLPQAKTYLESIGYKFKEIDQEDFSSGDEIESLNKLGQTLLNVAKAVKDKTDAFKEEATVVSNTVVPQEMSALGNLEEKIRTVSEKINELVDKIKNPENTEVFFTPKLSNDFAKQIQGLINDKVFEINVSPKVSTSVVSDSGSDIESVLEEMDSAIEKTTKLTQQEKIFRNSANKTTSDFINGAKVSTKTIHDLREEIKNILISKQRGEDIGVDGLYEIMSNDAGYVTSLYGSSYSDIKKKIRNTKIKYSDTDRAEFGDEWKDLENTFGRNLRKNEGIDPLVLLNELASQYSEISTEGILTTQDALTYLRDYIKETPEKYADIYRKAYEKGEMGQLSEWDEKLSEIAKTTTIPTHLMGEAQADTLEQLDDFNAKLNAKYEETEEIFNKHQEEFNASESNITSKTNTIQNIDNLELADAMEKVDKEKADDSTNQITEESAELASKEAQAMADLFDKAIKAAEAKEKFASANGQVLSSIIESLSALDSEGNGFENLNKIINKLSNEDKTKALVKSLQDIQSVLNSNIDENSMIQAIKSIAEQGDNLKDLATVLKASKDEIENAQKATNASTKSSSSETAREKALSRYIDLLNRKNLLEAENISKSKNGRNIDRENEIRRVSEEITKLNVLNLSKEEEARVNQEVASSQAKLTDAINSANVVAEKQSSKDASALVKYQNDINSAVTSLDVLNSKRRYIPEFKDELNELRTTLSTMQGNSEKIDIVTDEELQQLAVAIARLKELSKQATLAENKAANENAIQKNLARINDVLSSNTKSSFKRSDVYQDYVRLQELFKSFDTSRPQSELNELVTELLSVDARFKELDDTVKGGGFLTQFTHRLSDMNAKFIAQYFSFQDIIRYARSAITTITELNDAFIELSKVSNTSIENLESDFQSYANIAKDIGGTISDTINATADWARMGYNIPDSKQLAEVAMLYKNVGDGIDITTANQSLISTLQGYQMQADEAEHIVDVFNEVANNFAIDSAGIGEALQRSASSLNAANTSLEESVALVTAANTVVQNPESVGTTFKTNCYCLCV